MNKNYIKKGKGLFGRDLYVFDSLDSTNTWVFNNSSFHKHGDVVQGLEQTAGRGRFERQWHAPKNSALLMSVAIDRRHISDNNLSWLPLSAAIAVHQALSSMKLDVSLKWPNDIIAGNKKICGILAETKSDSSITALGIGVNINQSPSDLHPEIADRATSMRILTGVRKNISNVRDCLLDKLEEILTLLFVGDINELYRLWKENDCFIGSKIRVTLCDKIFEGIYLGITKEGNLQVLTANGNIQNISAGDASIV